MIFDPLLIELYNKNRKKVEHLTLNALSPFHDKCFKEVALVTLINSKLF